MIDSVIEFLEPYTYLIIGSVKAIVVAGAIMYWIYFTLLKRLTVAMSTIAMLAVPVVAVISDAFWLWKFPLWIDLGALGLIGVAVTLALNKPA